MLENIKLFFEKNFAPSEAGKSNDHKLKLATASLFIEMMFQDHKVTDDEKHTVQKVLQENFDLSVSETKELYVLAEQEVKGATDYHQFTKLIAKHFDQSQKIKIIEYLWMIAYSDYDLDKHEEHMVRRISDLIYVPHKEFLQAKHRVQKILNLPETD
jgi:uncharacterized tellurite resistance protein B-like protein